VSQFKVIEFTQISKTKKSIFKILKQKEARAGIRVYPQIHHLNLAGNAIDINNCRLRQWPVLAQAAGNSCASEDW
jgi:hypothetical protein